MHNTINICEETVWMTVSPYCAQPSYILSNFLTKTKDSNILRIICKSLLVSVGRILIEMCVCVPLLPAHRCLNAVCVSMLRCGPLQVSTACVCVSVCVSVTVCHWCTCLHSFQRIIHFLLKWGSSPGEEGLKGGREQAFILFQQQLVVWGVNTSAGHRDREREGQGGWERRKKWNVA